MTPASSLRPDLRSRARWLGRCLVMVLLGTVTVWRVLVPEVLADTSRTKADLEALSKARVAALTAAQQPLIALADKYRAALQKQKETVQAAGDLDGVLAVDAALAELNAGAAAADPPSDSNVSRLRAIYLRERQALALRLQPEIARVESDHLSRLEKLMADLGRYVDRYHAGFLPCWRRRSAVGGRRSAVGGRRSAVGGRWSVVGSRRSAVGGRWSAVGGRPGPRLSAGRSG